tara:strand:- start:519 stop:695 length:177 start_codon:yes stop_codon:yes gene_type:complete
MSNRERERKRIEQIRKMQEWTASLPDDGFEDANITKNITGKYRDKKTSPSSNASSLEE